jgi:hypothetical protein
MSDNYNVSYLNPNLVPVEIPRITIANFVVHASGTEVQVILQNAVPMADRTTGAISDQQMLQPVAIVGLSPGGAKDLLLMLTTVVENHEKNFGPIMTPLSQSVSPLSSPPDRLHRA